VRDNLKAVNQDAKQAFGKSCTKSALAVFLLLRRSHTGGALLRRGRLTTATTTVNAAIAQAHNLPGLIGNPRCNASALVTQLRGKLLGHAAI